MSKSTKDKINPHILPLQAQWISPSVKEIKHLFATRDKGRGIVIEVTETKINKRTCKFLISRAFGF